MKSFITILLLISSSFLYAKGVSAGTVIENSATLSFSMQDEEFNIESNLVTDVVSQLIDVDVSWMDTRPIGVSKGDKGRVLTFKVINSGNGSDSFGLQSEQAGGHSDFETKGNKIYIDSNNNLKLDNDDKKISTVSLDADEVALIFISSDIGQKVSAISGSKSFLSLKATSSRGGSGKRGKLHKGEGIDGIDAIDGIGGGVGWESGTYKLLNTNVRIEKNVYSDGRVVNRFYVGSILTIKIDVYVQGEGIVHNLNVRDKLPKGVEYVNNTLRLDEKLLSDARDGDKGTYLDLEKKVSLFFKKLKSSSKHTISYKVKVKKD